MSAPKSNHSFNLILALLAAGCLIVAGVLALVALAAGLAVPGAFTASEAFHPVF